MLVLKLSFPASWMVDHQMICSHSNLQKLCIWPYLGKKVFFYFWLGYVSVYVCIQSCSVMSDSLQPHGLLLAPLSMEFFRQESWSGSPCPPPGDLPDSGIKPRSLMSLALAGRFFTTGAIRETQDRWDRFVVALIFYLICFFNFLFCIGV